jgi:hypothetical protein
MRALSLCFRLKLFHPFGVFDFILDKTKKD